MWTVLTAKIFALYSVWTLLCDVRDPWSLLNASCLGPGVIVCLYSTCNYCLITSKYSVSNCHCFVKDQLHPPLHPATGFFPQMEHYCCEWGLTSQYCICATSIVPSPWNVLEYHHTDEFPPVPSPPISCCRLYFTPVMYENVLVGEDLAESLWL